ncbi:MAG: DNA repair protein RecN [Lachnospiraceae bacterium]|nr:DNA repair protein RecN [Lachnospiraceae bacterium]
MLQSIHVKNLALIEESEVEFGDGFNIITGETGAGKSLLIGSVNLALGGKFEPSSLRKGADSGLVELVFYSKDERVEKKMKEMDLPLEDGQIILTRKLTSGKSSSRINGETVTLKQVQELAEELIDIHGQHEHQSLLKKSKHLEILDAYGEDKTTPLLKQIKTVYEEWKEAKQELEENDKDRSGIEREKSLLEFECNEIEAAALTSGEDSLLENRYRIMSNSKKILEALSETYGCTSSDSDMGSAASVGQALRSLSSVVNYDDRLGNLEAQLSDIEALLNDFNRELSSYLSDYEFEDSEFAEVTERLDLLNELKRKYGRTIDDVLEYLNQSREKLLKYENFDAFIEGLKIKEKEAYSKLISLCDELGKIRKKLAAELAEKLKAALVNLNFLTVEFSIEVEKTDKPGLKGMDEVEFLISTNPGEALKPLGNVASGGELSRIMLAIKTVLARKDHIDTLIFDEIDSGISGRTAWKVSEQLGLLGKEHQVLCITHLPQIAAMSDVHFVIEKSASDDTTRTVIREIEGEESVSELARLLGSDEESEAALTNARDMKKKALDFKQGNS